MFESIVLRSLLGDGEYFNKCFGILKSEYFKSFGDQQVFKLIREYYGKYHQKPQRKHGQRKHDMNLHDGSQILMK